jgi:hypothetical protein
MSVIERSNAEEPYDVVTVFGFVLQIPYCARFPRSPGGCLEYNFLKNNPTQGRFLEGSAGLTTCFAQDCCPHVPGRMFGGIDLNDCAQSKDGACRET